MNFFNIPVAEAKTAAELVGSINRVIINPLITVLFSLAIVLFAFGLVKYLLNPESDQIRKDSKQHMVWGVIGIFIMISVFGIMSLIINTLK